MQQPALKGEEVGEPQGISTEHFIWGRGWLCRIYRVRCDEARKFGFRWFVPELAKHKPIWRDVLLASLAIQLIGLATPLFTQVIIDKVVVHHTQSTLIAVAVALAMFLVFNAAMTGMRQYL